MPAYRYPPQRHRRKHGPQGYASPAQFREWLRDEFVFRCVYCLEREQWVNRTGHFHGASIDCEGMSQEKGDFHCDVLPSLDQAIGQNAFDRGSTYDVFELCHSFGLRVGVMTHKSRVERQEAD